MSTIPASETMQFQAEAKQLLELMIHSVYSEKDVFLRELISNASDAMDKLRVESLLNQNETVNPTELGIRLTPDPENRTLTIEDNGIGMNREDIVKLLGTIAHSGTREFSQKNKEGGEALIGQFGVGFYSSFIVAEKVVVESRKFGETEGVHWESTGDGTFTVAVGERTQRGTAITLHLRPVDEENGMHDYTSHWTLSELVKRYSDFIAYPIRTEKTNTEPGKEKDDAPVVTVEDVTLNSQKALWTKAKEDITEEERNEFYKHISKDWNNPFETIHLKAEGTFEYYALTFIPEKAPMDLFYADGKKGLQLYVKRVFIMDDCEELLPQYLRFVRGVVDAQDLPLNISREILQKDRHIEMIRKRLSKKVLDVLGDMRTETPDRFKTFYKEFGRALKEGIYSDAKNRDQILEMSLFHSTGSEEMVSLGEYIERMKEGQEHIYYLTGETLDKLKNSPHLEAFKKKDVEVLLLTDPVDDVWLTNVNDFKDKTFQSVAQGELKLGNEEDRKKEEEQKEQLAKDSAGFLKWLGSQLDEVKEVRVSSRLTESAVCLVGDDQAMSANLEKLMKAMGQAMPPSQRILEINLDHPLISNLKQGFETNADNSALKERAKLLYGIAVLSEGGEVASPGEFSRLLTQALSQTM
jgi:molecular chaperone HtpG